MAGTEYFGETAVQQRDHMPVNLYPLLQKSLTTKQAKKRKQDCKRTIRQGGGGGGEVVKSYKCFLTRFS